MSEFNNSLFNYNLEAGKLDNLNCGRSQPLIGARYSLGADNEWGPA